jgi:hypothetical protein
VNTVIADPAGSAWTFGGSRLTFGGSMLLFIVVTHMVTRGEQEPEGGE